MEDKVQGAGLVCLSMHLEQIGMPIEAVANCMGDVAGGLIVSGSEGLLNRELYNEASGGGR